MMGYKKVTKVQRENCAVFPGQMFNSETENTSKKTCQFHIHYKSFLIKKFILLQYLLLRIPHLKHISFSASPRDEKPMNSDSDICLIWWREDSVCFLQI